MRYKIAICDDSRDDQTYVMGVLKSWAEMTGRRTEIHTFISAEQFLFQYAEEQDFDILILDIEMGKMNGVDLAKKLRKENSALQIIFVTGFPDHMAEGYEVDAVHYLLKPLERDRFFKAMEKAVSHLEQTDSFILLQNHGDTVKIAVNDICFVEVFSHSCVLHTVDEQMEYRTAISKLEDELGEQFVRVHRSFLVNLEHVRRIAKTEIILDNGEAVPLSRRKYFEVNRAFIDHFKGKLEIK